MTTKSIKENDLTDEQLVREIVKNNNVMLFEQLYDRYEKKVYNKCYGFAKSSAEAEDLAQDVFLMLFVKLGSFKGRSKFSSWVYSVTYNFCVNYVNRNSGRRIKEKSDSISDNADRLAALEDDDYILDFRYDTLKRALDLVSPEDKTLLLLKYQDDVSIKELSELMQIGESAVKMRLKRAKGKVQALYNEISL